MSETEREFRELVADAEALRGEWLPDTPEQVADRAATQAWLGPLQTIWSKDR